MKTIRAELIRIINNLETISENLGSLGKSIEATMPQVRVEEYYKILLASERLRECIQFLREIAGRTKNVISTT